MDNFALTETWLAAHFPELSEFSHLGDGGQKLVFTAVENGRRVVLKLFKATETEMIRREILAVQQVRSPRVPQILDHGVVETPLGPAYWIKEEFVEGETLRKILERGCLDGRDTLRLARQVLEAIVHAEQAQIVHRDVKPDNIMRDAKGDFWLLDFGIARHLSLDSMTATVLPFGKLTPGYAPPEQARNRKGEIDGRADLFALGVTLYEAATGTNPFRAGTGNPLEMLQRVDTLRLDLVPIPVEGAEDFPTLVAAMTQRRRDHRPSTAAEAMVWLNEICVKAGV